jgi:hypothetical protein
MELKKYDYKTAKIAGFKTLGQMELPNGYFGGRVHRIAELKNEDVYLILDHISNVIVVLHPVEKEVVENVNVETNEDEVKKEANEVVGEVKEVVTCDGCGREFKNAFALSGHKRFCTK